MISVVLFFCRRFAAVLFLILITFIPITSICDEEPRPMITFDNKDVNKALINLYEKQPSIWHPEQIYIIGLCYVAEKKPDKAKIIFEKIVTHDPKDFRALRALGNVNHVMGNTNRAEMLYTKAWEEGKDLPALKMLAAIKLQQNDIASLKKMVEPLISHQQDNIGIPKILLAYAIMTDDEKDGARVLYAVVKDLTKETVRENKELRNLLIGALKRYKDMNIPSIDLGLTNSVDEESKIIKNRVRYWQTTNENSVGSNNSSDGK